MVMLMMLLHRAAQPRLQMLNGAGKRQQRTGCCCGCRSAGRQILRGQRIVHATPQIVTRQPIAIGGQMQFQRIWALKRAIAHVARVRVLAAYVRRSQERNVQQSEQFLAEPQHQLVTGGDVAEDAHPQLGRVRSAQHLHNRIVTVHIVGETRMDDPVAEARRRRRWTVRI